MRAPSVVHDTWRVNDPMPARSKAQRRAAAMALHHPERLHAANKGLATMSLSSLMHYASTSERRLPRHVKKATRR